MLSDEADMASSWWPTFKMNVWLVDEVLDNLSYLHEVTNAYATELTWTLAVVLGLTSLYIWRSLDLQEASRKHLYMVNYRPVFSTAPSPSLDAPTSCFPALYKSRYSVKGKTHEEERLNALGYDTLRTKVSRHIVPRAAWKRHVTGTEDEQLLGGQLWDISPSYATNLWGRQHRVAPGLGPPARPVAARAAADANAYPSSARKPPVPAQRRRKTSMVGLAPEITVQDGNPHVLSREPRQMHQFPQPMTKPKCQVNHTRVRRSSGGMEGAHPMNTNPLAPENTQEPAILDHAEMITHPVRVADNVFLLGETPKEVKRKHKKHSERSSDSERKEHHGDHIEQDGTKSDTPHIEGDKLTDKSKTEHTPITEQNAVSGEHDLMEKEHGTKKREVEKRLRRRYVLPSDAAAEQSKTVCAGNTERDNTCPSQLSGLTAGDEEPEDGRILPQKLGHESAVSASEKVDDHCQKKGQESNDVNCLSETKSLKSKIDFPVPWKNSNIPVCRKRTKAIQKPDFNYCSVDESKNAHSSHSENREMYDSAVMRAIKDEEEEKERERFQHSPVNILETSSEETSSVSVSEDDICGGAVKEVGFRLARLRKRLENSLHVVKESDADNEPLITMSSTPRVKAIRDELQMLFMKDDVMELDSWASSGAQPQLQENVTSSSRTPNPAVTEDCLEVRDGEPSGSTTDGALPGSTHALLGAANERKSADEDDLRPVIDPCSGELAYSVKENEKAHSSTADGDVIPETADTMRTKLCQKVEEKLDKTDSKVDAGHIPNTRKRVERNQGDGKGLFLDGGQVDEERLHAILERQNKRREDLKQRKKAKAEPQQTAESDRKDTPDHKPEVSTGSKIQRPCEDGKIVNQISEEHPDNNIAEHGITKQKINDERVSEPIITRSYQINEKQSLHHRLQVSTGTLGLVEYEEVNIQLLPKTGPPNTGSIWENSFMFMNGEMRLVPERESMARRRVRWRRQAEKMRREEEESKKRPPPVPPKRTHVNNNGQEGTESSHLPSGVSYDQSSQHDNAHESHKAGPNASGEDKRCETPDMDNCAMMNSDGIVRDSDTGLGAGETGIVKAAAKNEDICEERSLTPRAAASMFDPKIQLLKEQEKLDAERAARASGRERMSSAQFRANLLLFEQGNKSLQEYSQVKTNLQIFEEVTRAQRAQSLSPERKRNENKRRSPSSPRHIMETTLLE